MQKIKTEVVVTEENGRTYSFGGTALVDENTQTAKPIENKLYRIALVGCHDSTVVKMKLSKREYELLEVVAYKSQIASASDGCMPAMLIREIEEEE